MHAGVPNSVIFNEIMYHPSTGNEQDEFLELYNTTNATIDLNGWCFTKGIALCFTSGMTIGAHGYAVVSPNASETQAVYGITTLATYTGNLDNGGETVTLKDEALNIINSVKYDDELGWPTSPDGSGPSLELKDPTLDNALPTSWAGSLATGGTPGAENSVVSATALPIVANVSKPTGVSANQAVDITAQLTDAASAQLTYKLGFASDVTVPMYDDGAHNDGAAADGTYGAAIPGQAINTLVRYKVSATNIYGTTTNPGTDDSIHYYGYYVKDPSITSNAQIVQWFISDADYADLQTNGVITANRYNCVFVYGDHVYDNSQIRIKGNNTRPFPKHSYKVYLPSGYKIKLTGANASVGEFHLNADFKSESIAKTPTLWWAAGQSGLNPPDVIVTRLQRNGQFEGTYTFLDKYQKDWRDANGFNNGPMFEELGLVSGTGDLSQLMDWNTQMTTGNVRASQAMRDYVLDNNNIPELLSYMAFTAATRTHDQAVTRNTLQYFDTLTERWQVIPWDFDGSLSVGGSLTLVSPYDLGTNDQGASLRAYFTRLYDQPDLKQAYFRRLRTLLDKFYTDDQLLAKFNEFSSTYADDIALDIAKWPSDQRDSEDTIRYYLAREKLYMLNYLKQPWAIPGSQTDAERLSVHISEVNASATTSDQFIKFTNSSSEAVDMSSWVIPEINYTLPAGTVIPGGGTLYIVKDDIGYKANHGSAYIAGQYTNSLGITGMLHLKTDTNEDIDSYVY